MVVSHLRAVENSSGTPESGSNTGKLEAGPASQRKPWNDGALTVQEKGLKAVLFESHRYC